MNKIQEVRNLPSGLNITKHSFQFIINSIKKAPKIPFASLENPQNTSSSVNRVIVEILIKIPVKKKIKMKICFLTNISKVEQNDIRINILKSK